MNMVKETRAKTPCPFLQRLLAANLLPRERIDALLIEVGEDETALADKLLREGLLTPFQVKQLRAGATGFFVGGYVVLDCIGRGGNGIVFKAQYSLPPHRLVALKTIDTRCLHLNDEAMTRFRREIELITELHHPNVVRAYEAIQTRAQTYLVMEYVVGQDLATLVRNRGPLPVDEAIAYAVQAARGLAYAHRCGIVHRDLKPANLMLTCDGVVKIMDLGLARNIEDLNSELTLKGMCLGTPEFMAPEQAEDATRVDARGDLFSLGATLFHLLTAELHVTGSSYVQRLQRLLTEPPRPLATVRPDIHPHLAAIVDRLREHNPDDRPASAEEALALLEPFARTSTFPPRPWNSTHKFDLVLRVIEGKVSYQAACTQHGINAKEFESWRQRFLDGARAALDDSSSTAPAAGAGDFSGPRTQVPTQETERLKLMVK
jgi:serine/threonine protein kinase